MQITKITKPSSARRYEIYIDGEYALSVHEDVLVKYQLHKGMEVEASDLQEWLRAEEKHRIAQTAFRYLSYRPRTVHELRCHLLDKGFQAEWIEEVIEDLIAQGYLDDRKYAENWILERQNRKSLGSLRLQQELKRKGIAPEIIEEVLAHRSDNEERQLAMEVAQRRYLRICEEPWPKVERKLGQYLLYKGFSFEVVASILREFRRIHREEE